MISVLMSMYNETEKEIKEAIDSILAQSYRDLELIVINDNPKNKVLKEVAQIYIREEKVQFIENVKNIGLAKSLNIALAAAKGNYIARMDADDISLPERLERELQFLEKSDFDMVTTNRFYIDEKGNLTGRKGKLPTNPRDINRLLQWSCFVCHPSVLMRRKVLEQLGGYRCFRAAQDYDLWLRMLSAGYKIGVLDEHLIYYRQRATSLSTQNKIQRALIIQYQKELFRERKKNNGKDRFSIEEYENILEKADKLALDSTLIKAQGKIDTAIKNRKIMPYIQANITLLQKNRELFDWSMDLLKYATYRKLKHI